MARYIDADRFKSNLEKSMEKMHLIAGIKGVGVEAIIKALDMQPTADVVPKSEVEKIFEEIERIGGVSNGAFLYNSEIAELKKKYTGVLTNEDQT